MSEAATNASLAARRKASIPRGISTAHSIFADRAENSELWDVEGRRFIDFASGIAVLNTGHRHSRVMDAAIGQTERLTHAAFQVTGYEPYVALAERLNSIAPFDGEAKTLLLTTGAEAVENAVKIARAATGRSGVVACMGGFHGRTLYSLGLTGKVRPYKEGFGPFPANIFHIPFPSVSLGIDASDALAALERLFRVEVPANDVAAIIVEPVLGEGGYCAADPVFLAAIRDLCSKHGIVMIADEIQTGFARTGRMFAVEHFGIEPDLVTVAKGLGGGFPLAGVIGRSTLMDAAGPGGLGGTFAGNPVSCRAALAVLDVIADEDLLARSSMLGAQMRHHLESIKAEAPHPVIEEIRGLGAMVAFDIVEPGKPHRPDARATRLFVENALERGLILLSCGMHGNTIRLMPALTLADDVLKEAMATIRDVHLAVLPDSDNRR
ncbi:4-aminobutyrate--2-oxoglutarate transaminase [Erythrobacter sp. AP23]|uniref:4-aminobutyrate--2-oxoglutarate transaminase n=1 Tax=Erythrobacter sp. AP23 TaxID=499656 RepID=UPI00076C0097|nr:4-aminobutyrate--2-oxoglutarate transaminase [Erythrobacter sp. AP23]KWV93767.1 4-aminobutyrate aminotransferase [Erythrobacter sp. AP23]